MRTTAAHAVDARVTALETAMEKTDARAQTLAKLIKCARDADDEDRAELRASVDALRASVEARMDVESRASGERWRARGDGRGDGDADARAANAITRALEAFERRLDAKVASAAGHGVHYADAHVVDALRASVEGLRIELATERAARLNDVERLERECRTLREQLASVVRAPECDVRDGVRVSDHCSAPASHPRVVETRADEVAVDDDDDDEDEDDDIEPEQKEARPELEARRRRLRALYRELQTLST